MEMEFILSFLTLITGTAGLGLDIYGVWKLFSVEPIHIKKIDTAIFNATWGDWTKEEKTAYLVNELNDQIKDINWENRRRSEKAVKYRRFLIYGFGLQVISIGLAYVSETYTM
jgi:hypothetical protein